MRLLFVSFQLCVIGVAYMLVAIPLLAAATGLVYALATAIQYVGASIFVVGAEISVHYLLQAVGALPIGAGAPTAVAAASSLAGATSTLFTLAVPLLITVLINLTLGVLAYYRNWYKKVRKWAIVCTLIGLCFYLVPQAFVFLALFGQLPSGGDDTLGAGVTIFLVLAMLAWDSYFIISLFLFYRMPEHPDISKMIRWMPAMHIGLWCVLVLAWLGVLFIAGSAVNTAAAMTEATAESSGTPVLVAGFLINTPTIIGSVLVALSALPFFINARAVGKIFTERKKRFVLPLLLVDLAVMLFCLLLLPPIGVALALSTVWLYFVVEVSFFERDKASLTGRDCSQQSALQS